MSEFFVSLISALKGTSDLTVGNVISSNIFNSLLIVSRAATAAPISILPSTVRKDIPFALLSSAVLLLLCLADGLSRFDAAALLILFICLWLIHYG